MSGAPGPAPGPGSVTPPGGVPLPVQMPSKVLTSNMRIGFELESPVEEAPLKVNIHVVCQMAASRAGVGSCERGLSGVGVRWSSVGVSC